MATKIGSLFGDVTLRTAGMDKAIKSIGKKMGKMGKNFEKLGKSLSLKLTAPLVGFGALSVKAFAEQEKAEASLRAALQASGQEVDNNFSRLRRMASAIQDVTVVGDEMSLSLAQQGISMGLSAEKMDEAVRGAIGLSEAYDIELKTAMRAATGALQGQTEMLTRYIPELKNIEDPAERVALVQLKMAEGFSIAEAEAKTTGGRLKQLNNEMGDFQETIGGLLVEYLKPMTDELKELSENLNETDKELVKVGVSLGIAAAAIGPVMLGLGFLIKALGSLSSWIAIVGLGAAALSHKLGLVKEAGEALGQLLVDIFVNPNLKGAIGSFIALIGEVIEWFTGPFGLTFNAERVRSEVIAVFNAIGGAIDKALGKLKSLWDMFSKFTGARRAGENIGNFISKIAFRAKGGPVASGSPYIVGEQGPELFVPRASGAIVPNDALGGSGGGMVIHQHFHGNMDMAVVAALKNMKPTFVKWAVEGMREDGLRRV